MTRENIIRMAHEAQFEGFGNGDWVCTTEEIERFAALVEDAQSRRMHDEGMVTVGHMRQQIAAEREACAKVCEDNWYIDGSATACQFATAIRARGQA